MEYCFVLLATYLFVMEEIVDDAREDDENDDSVAQASTDTLTMNGSQHSGDSSSSIKPAPAASAASKSSKKTATSSAVSTSKSTRKSQKELWNERYQDLVEFQKANGHCLVPLCYPPNPSLAHWVKRQRNQYKALCMGARSSLSAGDRRTKLEQLGFVWDSRKAAWEERWQELAQYQAENGHCNVPKKYAPNQPLSIWVKCQRRQCKLYFQGQPSTITPERIQKLLQLGFDFNPLLTQQQARQQRRSGAIHRR